MCNRHHTINQHLCRWLLMSMDRQSGDELNLTQVLIANMLGVRREGVAEAAGNLHKLGVIEYKRGHIRVLNRPELQRLSCECYAVVEDEYHRLLPELFANGGPRCAAARRHVRARVAEASRAGARLLT